MKTNHQRGFIQETIHSTSKYRFDKPSLKHDGNRALRRSTKTFLDLVLNKGEDSDALSVPTKLNEVSDRWDHEC